MKLLTSKRGIELPVVFYAESMKDLTDIPVGVPFIRGSEDEYEAIVMALEFEILLKSARATGLKIDWLRILEENGFKGGYKEGVACSTFFSPEELLRAEELVESGMSLEELDSELSIKKITPKKLANRMLGSYVVDLEVLKSLDIIPTFLKDIEKAIGVNIHNGYKFNPVLYNKRLGLPLGVMEHSETMRNLIIIDISGSVPRSISSTILALSKTMSSQYYADLLITGSKSTLYSYEEVDSLDTSTIYEENGKDNDQVYFKKLVSEGRKYNTAIVFGDNDSPSHPWRNSFNRRTRHIKTEEGKELCKWEVENIISFHTHEVSKLAGYAEWFTCDNIKYMKDWATYFE